MKRLITIQGVRTVLGLSGVVLLFTLAVSSCTQRADPKVSELVTDLGARDWQVRRDAAEALGGVTPASTDTIGALEEALQDYDSRVRRSAARALGHIGPEAADSVPLLVDLLGDIDVGVIQAAAWALGQTGDSASSAVPTLNKLLAHADAGVREAAAESIGRIGPKARHSAPSLADALNDADPEVRTSAARALGRVGPKSEGTARKLIELLDDEDPLVRESATQALAQLGEPAVPVLVGALNHGNPIFLQSAVDALGKVGSPAVPLLVEKLNDDEGLLLVRRYAALALAKIDDEKVVPTLVGRLDDELFDIRMSAAEALGRIGPDAVAAIPKLVDLTRDRREAEIVREYAIVAMSRIAPRDENVVAALVDAVSDGEPKIFKAAVAALLSTKLSGQPADDADQTVQELIEQLEQGNPPSRETAALGLAAKGPDAAESVPALTRVLADQTNDSGLRTAAAMALGLIGLDAEPAVPVLTTSLKSADASLRRASLVALKRIGPQTKTIPALLDAMRAGDLSIRGPASASIQTFAKARMQTWEPMIYQSDAPVLRNWLRRHDALYGVSADAIERDSRRRDTVKTDYFQVLGGRAAIRESVQLQVIESPPTQPDEHRSIPISEIDPVNVKSHPFEDMLDESERRTGAFPLADLVPPNRFFAYFKSVRALQESLDGGSNLFLRLESAFSVKSVEYDLKARYLSKLGMSESVLPKLEALKIVKDLAIIAPDLFFVDGTDLTVIVRLAHAGLLKSFLTLIRTGNTNVEGVAKYELSSGAMVYLAARGDLLLISTNEKELEAVTRLRDRNGADSLGHSAEFQYMLQRLPLENQTQAYFYLSDPFIRHLVGPKTKISQLRRMQARAEMEILASGAMLFKLDGHHVAPQKHRLIELGYVPKYLAQRDYVLLEALSPYSESFGTISRLKPLSELPVAKISRQESAAYDDFAKYYSRYWRQFFDPIAIRLNKTDDRSFEMSTFILPLLDSVLYDQLREALATMEGGSPLRVPELRPKPALMLSVNLSDDQRIKLSKALAGALVKYTSVDPDVFDSVGSAIHLAVQDSSPIVALGSGDVRGAFSEEVLRMQGFKSFIPFLLSMITQPSTILVELAEPETVQAFLREAVLRRSADGGKGEFYQLEGQETWIYTFDVFEMAKVHLRVAIADGYLMVSNLPWSQSVSVGELAESALNGARLRINLDTITRQLPALHIKAFSDYRLAAVDGMGYLYPLLASGVASTVDEATDKHATLFGFRPVHPVSGRWSWQNGDLESSIFGTALQPVQPEYVPGDRDFGLFPRFDSLDVNVQLEDTGLRTRIRWNLAAGP